MGSEGTFIRQSRTKFFSYVLYKKKFFWGPKMHFSFFDFYHKISYGENDFVIQII